MLVLVAKVFQPHQQGRALRTQEEASICLADVENIDHLEIAGPDHCFFFRLFFLTPTSFVLGWCGFLFFRRYARSQNGNPFLPLLDPPVKICQSGIPATREASGFWCMMRIRLPTLWSWNLDMIKRKLRKFWLCWMPSGYPLGGLIYNESPRRSRRIDSDRINYLALKSKV